MELRLKDRKLSTEDINRYGFWVKTNGIKTENYTKNPVVLVQHETWKLPVGKVENLRKEGSDLIGDVVFDDKDPEAVRIYNKYENGYLNSFSISFNEVVLSESSSDIKPGQKYPTVIASDLLEISVATIPANPGASGQLDVQLLDKEGKVIKLNFIQTEKKSDINMKTIEELTAENVRIAQSNVELQRKLDDAIARLTAYTDKSAKDLVELHFKRGAITEPEREIYENAAKQDYEKAKLALESRKGNDTIKHTVEGMKAGDKQPDNRDSWTLLDWGKNDQAGLEKMKQENPDKYKQLCLKSGITYID